MALALGIFSMLALTSCEQFAEQTPSGIIKVVANPTDANITCDGVDYGNAPVTIEGLAAGRHLLVANKDGYYEKRMTINLLESQETTQKIELEPITGLVLVESTPVSADVTIEGAFKGKTPLLISDIGIGSHRVKLYKESYFPRELTLKISDRTPQHIETTLTSDSASLTIESSPSGAAVTVNGSSVGKTPAEVERIKTGETTVEISLSGYMPYQQELRLRAGEEHSVDANLVPLPSGLTVYSVPDNARVYINDQLRGETPLTMTNLNVGSYGIRVDKKGYEPQSRSIELNPGARRIEEFRLNSNSGKIVLVTEPARVKVYLDGDMVGSTEAKENEVISEPLEIDMVEEGAHRLNLSRKGYDYDPKTLRVRKNQIVSLHEKMNRLFVPDTIVRTGTGSGDVYRGILVRRHPNGDVELETRPGIIVRIEKDDIESVGSL